MTAVLAVDLAAMVLGMPVVLFPEVASHTYGDPPGGGPVLGLFYAAYPAGVIMSGLFSGTFTRVRRPGRTMAAAAIAWGATVVALGLTTHLWVALTALVLGGAVNFVLSTHRNAITQAHTDDALLGRVQGLLTVVLTGGPQLANLLHGAAGTLIGPRPAIIVGGLLTMTAVVATLRAVPELSAVEQTRHPAASHPAPEFSASGGAPVPDTSGVVAGAAASRFASGPGASGVVAGAAASGGAPVPGTSGVVAGAAASRLARSQTPESSRPPLAPAVGAAEQRGALGDGPKPGAAGESAALRHSALTSSPL